MDAGMGGYSVVKELQKILPDEDIVYFGEGANQPYGNRSEEDILFLVRQCLDFLKAKKVKAVAVACNTISSLIDKYSPFYDFRIFSIVQAGSDDVVSMGLPEVGVLSTVFTAQTRCYEKLIRKDAPQTRVYAQGCPMLARILEDGDFNKERIEDELRATLGHLAEVHPDLKSLVLGCTHYPMALDYIKRLYPQFTAFINPAATQARMVADYLRAENALNAHGSGSLRIYTTSSVDTYERVAKIVGLVEPYTVELAPAPVPLGK